MVTSRKTSRAMCSSGSMALRMEFITTCRPGGRTGKPKLQAVEKKIYLLFTENRYFPHLLIHTVSMETMEMWCRPAEQVQ